MNPTEQPDDTICVLSLGVLETLAVFRSLHVYLQSLSQQPDPPLDSLLKVVELMRVLRPAAQQAAQIYQTNGIVAPE